MKNSSADAEGAGRGKARRVGQAPGEQGAMLIRLGRVRPTGTAVAPAASVEVAAEAPAAEPAPPVPAEPRRAPLPTRERRRSLKVIERNKSIDRLMEASRPRVSGTLISFLALVALPTLLAGLYFAFVASPQYVSEFRFSVRSEDPAALQSSSSSSATMLTIVADNFLVADYVESRDAVDSLEERLGVREHFAQESIDWWSRFDPAGSAEDLVDYWTNQVYAHFDMTTGINTVEVSAFSPEDAYQIAKTLRDLCEKLVNEISEKARRSQVAFAEEQLARAEQKLQDVSRAETEFRSKIRTVDASKSADADLQLTAQLRAEVTSMRAELQTLQGYLDADSPRIRVLQSSLASAEKQLSDLGGRVAESDEAAKALGGATSAETIAQFENFRLQKEFAAQSYQSALTAFEMARMRAASNSLYLATYVEPAVPQDASYPRVILDTFLFFLAALGVWVVGTLVVLSIRDHAA